MMFMRRNTGKFLREILVFSHEVEKTRTFEICLLLFHLYVGILLKFEHIRNIYLNMAKDLCSIGI